MKRLLLDTNIYGRMMLDSSLLSIEKAIRDKVIIHGFKVIREELRNTPQKVKIGSKSLRIELLHIYDHVISKSYDLTLETERLCEDYFITYKELGGAFGVNEMRNDFLIVACATIHEMDIIVSEDSRSLLSEDALKAYSIVNALYKRKNPAFIKYLEFKRWLFE